MSIPSDEQPKLTPKQDRFVRAYCGEARFNASKAVILAGYQTKNPNDLGYQLRNAPHIRARIDAVLEATTLTGREILQELTDVAMRGLGEYVEIVATDKDGIPIAAKMDAHAKMKALELLGKSRQLFTDNVNLHGDLGVTYEIVGISDPDLAGDGEVD